MNWDAIGAIGQAVSAVALLFVVLQVWHARVEMTRATRAARTDTLLGIFQDQVGDASRIELYAKVRKAFSETPRPFDTMLMQRAGVTWAEAIRMNWDMLTWWQYYAEKVIPYASELSPGDRFQANAAMRALFSSTVGSLWFENAKPALNPDAVRYVENLLAQPG